MGSGAPAIAPSERLACSPGAIASLIGSGFAELGATVSDESGGSLTLSGTKVSINGQSVSVLAASDGQVTFLCPTLDVATPLTATVETDTGVSEPLTATMQQATPTILSLDGSGQNQGVISFAETTDLAMPRNFQVPGHPAQPGDEIRIWGSGLGSPSMLNSSTVQVDIGSVAAEIASVSAVPGYAGLYAIQARVPALIDFGDAVPVEVRINTPDGKQVDSNLVTIAVEPVNQ